LGIAATLRVMECAEAGGGFSPGVEMLTVTLWILWQAGHVNFISVLSPGSSRTMSELGHFTRMAVVLFQYILMRR
jgi:hypothetical protein